MRIRTIKPEFFTHDGLYDAEIAGEGLPLRLAYIGLWCAADRAGRFKWEPRRLGAQILPYDDVDFSRVLDALVTRGFILRYIVNGVEFGCIPSWSKHQVINNRERESEIPQPPQDQTASHACPTRAPRVPHASKAEGKGTEGEGEGNSIPPKPPLLGGGEQQTLPTDIPTNDPPPPQQHKTPLQIRAEKLFGRRPTRQWVENEQRAWAKNRGAIEATTDEDWAALEAFYAFEDTSRHTVYRRRDLKTLINNWCSEIDKANEFRRNGPQLKPGAPYVANDGPTTEGF